MFSCSRGERVLRLYGKVDARARLSALRAAEAGNADNRDEPFDRGKPAARTYMQMRYGR